MIENMIAKRYARALIAVAGEQSQEKIDEFGKQLKALCEAGQANENLLQALGNHFIDPAARERVVEQLAQKLGLATEVQNFLKLLIRKGRMEFFSNVFEQYMQMSHDIMNRETMTVESAVELSDENYQSLIEEFGKLTGKTMILRKKVNPDVIGGVRVHIHNKVYDYTVQNQLELMKQRLLAH